MSRAIADAGLKELAALKTLKSLGLGMNRFSREAMTEFQKALPGCKVDWGH